MTHASDLAKFSVFGLSLMLLYSLFPHMGSSINTGISKAMVYLLKMIILAVHWLPPFIEIPILFANHFLTLLQRT
jgi:hypothetical protein